MKRNYKKGFTLIEILIVIGIIAVLATIVIVAINPAKQFAQARNTQRESNVNTLLNAIGQNIVDNKGVPISATSCTGITNAPDATTRNIGTGVAQVNLNCLVPTYIPSALPMDPNDGNAADSKYTVTYTLSRYTICSPEHAETAIPGSTAFCLTR
ncbi:MAG TPA: prepilin-type N-terminal cleavage/methylation domain-containing protein [Candidatus Paceibacterota bacterium]|jgi:type IV pilus assembly protein PilA|nr:prepilin-type N-terminal cleavage/methylation domain-containing protein [Candidatus Paceibacterota bacterium]